MKQIDMMALATRLKIGQCYDLPLNEMIEAVEQDLSALDRPARPEDIEAFIRLIQRNWGIKVEWNTEKGNYTITKVGGGFPPSFIGHTPRYRSLDHSSLRARIIAKRAELQSSAKEMHRARGPGMPSPACVERITRLVETLNLIEELFCDRGGH